MCFLSFDQSFILDGLQEYLNHELFSQQANMYDRFQSYEHVLFHQGWGFCRQRPTDREMLRQSGKVEHSLNNRYKILISDFNDDWTQPSWTGSMGWQRTTRAGWSPSTRTRGAG